MSQIQMTGMRVVRPGFDSTSHAFERRRASQAAGSDSRLAQKRNRVPSSGDRYCVATICVDVCRIPTSCRLCPFGMVNIDHYQHRNIIAHLKIVLFR